MTTKNYVLLLVFCSCYCWLFSQPPAEYGQTGKAIAIFNTSPINSDELEFSPVLYENGLVYVSRYKSGPVDPNTNKTYLQLFYSELDPYGMPGKPAAFSTELNSAYEEGPVTFSRSGDRIFFTRSNSSQGVSRRNRRGKVVLNIYEAERGPFDWENVQGLAFNSDNHSSMHPALSADETQLFFTSDREGGYGGTDLYVTEFKNGFWSPPVNLGPEINTARNEAFPFMHESGVLFFASEGHDGNGGYDLFMIDMSARKWGPVLNLGEPFNSEGDDLGLVMAPDGKSGYFSSSRAGGFGQDDVYMFKAPLGLGGISRDPVLSSIITITDKTNSRRLVGADVRLFALNKDGLIDDENAYDLELQPSENGDGEMVMTLVRRKENALGEPIGVSNRDGEVDVNLQPFRNYLLLVSKNGYFTHELIFSTSVDRTDRPLDIVLEPSNCITLNGRVKSDRFEIPIPNVTLTLTNKCDSSTKIYRSNIRGEYEICLPIGCDFTLRGEKDGYEAGSTEITTAKLRGSRSLDADLFIHPTSDAILREPIREGTVIVLENIYYDFNKSAIRKGAAQDLEALASLMGSYPSMQIELGSHTDSRGTYEYNQDLSERRAQSAKEFLLKRGVAAHRIRTVGYGETQLRNSCVDDVDCSETEHRINRRTEVRVLNIDERVKINVDDGGSRD